MTLHTRRGGIFLSVGNGLSAIQERFVTGVETLLREQERFALTLGRNAHTDGDPLAVVREMIGGSSGVLVVAFARLRIDTATEYPDTPRAVAIAPRQTCTVWNQLEAAMAFQAAKPLLVLAEEGLHREGILDPTASATPVVWFTPRHDREAVPPPAADALRHWIQSLPPASDQ